MDNTDIKTYISESKIKGAGKGLFAKRSFAPGEIVAVFDDIKEVEEKEMGAGLKDGTGGMFNYDQNCHAHFANDVVNVPSMSSLYNNILNGDSLIEKHDGIDINASINAAVDSQYKFLIVATKDIFPDDEIYVHYGLEYWLSKAFSTKDFLRFIFSGSKTDPESFLFFPKCINELANASKSISEYVSTFYGPQSKWDLKDDTLNITGYDDDGSFKFYCTMNLQEMPFSDSLRKS